MHTFLTERERERERERESKKNKYNNEQKSL